MYDHWVHQAQIWVNATYGSVTGYVAVDEDGETGWAVMFALTRALQHELGITTLSDNFGDVTLAELESTFGNVDSSTTNTNVITIMQCALWCKGYWGGTHFGVFSTALDLDVMISDMGFTASMTLPPKAFKSLLTMDAYVLVNGGSAEVRAVQQWLNSRYIDRDDFFIVPCDGHFSRDVQTGLMLAIQYEIGMADGVANGNFGPGTQQGIRDYGDLEIDDVDGVRAMVSLFEAALIFNGYAPLFDGYFGTSTGNETLAFQEFVELPASGKANYATWASLLVSTGDTSRPGIAADTNTPLTTSKANQLYASGYRTVGRYLTVASKRYAPGEIERIFAAGLKTFPIFQNYNDGPEYFSYELGYSQAVEAVRRARQLGFKAQTTIYFAVDYDATGEEIEALVIPYFQGVRDGAATSESVPFRVGVYGTRNVCSQVSAASLAVSSFVSGMSWGYSGNLGFGLPANWAYDQVLNLEIGSGSSLLEIDKDIQSARAEPSSSSGVDVTPLDDAGSGFDEEFYWRFSALQYLVEVVSDSNVNAAVRNELVLTALQKPTYWWYIDNANELGAVWRNVMTPPMDERVIEPYAVSVQEAAEALESIVFSQTSAEDGPYQKPALVSTFGDTTHWAATTRGYTARTLPVGGVDAAVPDMGGWAGDLVTFWNDYEAARLASPGGALDVRAWTAANLGDANVSTTFGKEDLKADMAAYECARLLLLTSRPLDDAVRTMLLEMRDDPGWLADQFMYHRFSDRNGAVSAAESVFTTDWSLQDITPLFLLDTRAPGGTGGTLDPSPTILATELNEFAQGFADAIEAAIAWTSL